MTEEEQWRQKLERLALIQERIQVITDRVRGLRLQVTEPVRVKTRERFFQFLDRVAPPPATQQATKCPACGAEVSKEAKTCPACGVGLPPPVKTPETPAVKPHEATRKYILA